MFRAVIRPDLELRLLEERHAETVFALVHQDRAYLRQWLPWVDATLTPEDTLAFIRSSLEKFASGSSVTAGIWHRDQFAGTVGTHEIMRITQRVEMGYWIGQSFQGHGLITDACRAMITYLFEARNLNRVEIHCAVGNSKSAAVARRLGFQLEGTLREAALAGDRLHDAYVFGMLRKDWR